MGNARKEARKIDNWSHLLSVLPAIGRIVALRRRGRQYEERQAALHPGQYVADLVDALAPHLDAVHLQHLVALVQQARLVRGAASHHATCQPIIFLLLIFVFSPLLLLSTSFFFSVKKSTSLENRWEFKDQIRPASAREARAEFLYSPIRPRL